MISSSEFWWAFFLRAFWGRLFFKEISSSKFYEYESSIDFLIDAWLYFSLLLYLEGGFMFVCGLRKLFLSCFGTIWISFISSHGTYYEILTKFKSISWVTSGIWACYFWLMSSFISFNISSWSLDFSCRCLISCSFDSIY